MKRFLKSKLIVAVLLVLTVMIMAFPAAAASERPVGQFEITCRGDDVKLIQQRLVDLGYMQQKHTTGYFVFLHDSRVPATNNEAERRLRSYKRKQAQAVTFRSFENIDYLCQCMSMLVLMRLEDPANIYDRVSRIFG